MKKDLIMKSICKEVSLKKKERFRMSLEEAIEFSREIAEAVRSRYEIEISEKTIVTAAETARLMSPDILDEYIKWENLSIYARGNRIDRYMLTLSAFIELYLIAFSLDDGQTIKKRGDHD